METHEKIKNLRIVNQMTQEQIANELHITKGAYGRLERGETKISEKRLREVAEIFKIHVSELLAQDKNLVLLLSENSDYSANYYLTNESVLAELEKAKTTIQYQQKLLDSKDELLAQKDNEITALKEIIALMKK